jgi:hypothetical protein
MRALVELHLRGLPCVRETRFDWRIRGGRLELIDDGMKTPRGSPRSRRPRPSRAWLQLRKQFPQQLSDLDEAVYALTAPLIRAIELECPGLLGHDDLRFESEFRRLAGDGFFRGSKFVFPLLATYAGTATPERSYRLPKRTATIP